MRNLEYIFYVIFYLYKIDLVQAEKCKEHSSVQTATPTSLFRG